MRRVATTPAPIIVDDEIDAMRPQRYCETQCGAVPTQAMRTLNDLVQIHNTDCFINLEPCAQGIPLPCCANRIITSSVWYYNVKSMLRQSL